MSTRDLVLSLRYAPALPFGGRPDEKWPPRKTLFFVLSASLGLWLTIISLVLPVP